MRIAWVWVALGAALVTSCMSFDEARCADGRVCPAGSRCDVDRCISPQQIEACANTVDGEPCTLVGGSGTCRKGACEPWRCGDGEVNGSEQCEGDQLGGMTCLDFNSRTPGGLACTAECKLDTSGCSACGDGILDQGEACDGDDFGSDGPIDCRDPRAGFYDPGLVKCSAICTWDVSGCTGFCGDGVMNGTELCDTVAPAGETCMDHGFDAGRLGCSQCGRAFAGCRELGWRRFVTPTTAVLQGIWIASNATFAVGDGGTIIRRTPTGVQRLVSPNATPNLYAAWGSASNDVYFVGDGGTILRYDGTSVTAMTSPTTASLRAIWGTGPTNIYAVGSGGVIVRYNGATWSTQVSNTTKDLRGISGSASNAIFVVGKEGTVAHSADGMTWTVTSSIPSPISVTADFSGVWVSAPNDAFAVTRNNEVFRFDGTWSAMATPASAGASDAAVVGGGSNDVFVVGSSVLHFDGTRWSKLVPPQGVTQLRAIGRSLEGDVWIAGVSGYLARWGGASWTASASGTTNQLRSVAAVATSDAWAVGSGGMIRRYDGSSWTQATSSTTALLTAVWAAGTSFAVAVGESGVIRHFDGTNWVTPTSSTSTDNLFGVWGAGSTNIFAAGNAGVVRRFDGTSWLTTVGTSSSVISLGLWGTSPTNVFAAGQTSVAPVRGTISQFQGTTWSEMATPTTTNLAGLWGSGGNDVFAVGDAILHYGSKWSRMTAGGRSLRAVSGTGPRNVFAVGDTGTLLHYDGIDWTPMRVLAADGASVTATLRSVAATPRSVIVVGDGGFVQRLSFSLRPTEVNCRDTWDDDGDGLPGCADSDCAADPYCVAGGTCAVARTLACGEIITASTIGRTSGRDFYRCSPNAETGGDVVYRFKAPTSTTVTATLSSFAPADLDLVVVGATPASDACDPDFACLGASVSATPETVTFPATAGQVYYVIVDGTNGAEGPFELRLSCP